MNYSDNGEPIALKRLFKVVNGSTPKSDNLEFWDGDIPWVTPVDLGNDQNKLITSTSRRITQAGLDSCGTSIVPAGSIILSCRAPIGSIGISSSEMCTNQGCKSLVKRFKNISERFFYYVLASSAVELNDLGKGTTFLELSTDALAGYKVPNYSFEKQEKIANFLDRETAKIDELIQKQEKLINCSLEMRQAYISDAVTKGVNKNSNLSKTNVKWFPEIPIHWAHSKLGLYSKRVIVGIAEAATQAYQDSGTPILRATNIRPMKIIGDLLYLNDEFADDRNSKSLKAGDLVTVRTGNAGVTALVPKELDGCQCFTMLITTVNEKLNPEFINYWINSSPAQSYFSIEGWGTAQVNISVPILKQLPIPVPPLMEQNEIVAYLDAKTLEIDYLINKTKESLLLLKERRDAIISSAVTGKIDVRNS